MTIAFPCHPTTPACTKKRVRAVVAIWRFKSVSKASNKRSTFPVSSKDHVGGSWACIAADRGRLTYTHFNTDTERLEAESIRLNQAVEFVHSRRCQTSSRQ